MDTLERTLAIEFNTAQPFTYYIHPPFKRLIEAGWAWRRMGLYGYWIVGFTPMGHAAAEMCGLYDDIRRNWQKWELTA